MIATTIDQLTNVLIIIGWCAVALGLYLCMRLNSEMQDTNNAICLKIVDLYVKSIEKRKEEELVMMYPNPVERQWIIEGRQKRMSK